MRIWEPPDHLWWNKEITREDSETNTGGVLQEKVFLEISWKSVLQNSQENTCARVIFFNEANLIKKESLAQMFSCKFCEISKNTVFAEHLPATVSEDFIRWSNHILLTIWESLLKKNLRELTQWHTFTNVNAKNYLDGRLAITTHTNVSEIETDAPLLDWPRVDVKAYLNERTEAEAIMDPTLCCSEIINASNDLLPGRTNTSWQKKIVIVLGENLVRCTYCLRACVNLFEAILQFENITVATKCFRRFHYGRRNSIICL